MTDAPEGPAAAPPERGGARRSPRVGDSGSPVGSTLSIVLAVVAVIAGFLILRAITNDDDDSSDDLVLDSIPTDDSTVTPATGGGDSSVPEISPTTTLGRTTTGATVVVANASGIGGSAAAMTTVLQGAGFTMGEPGNNTSGTNLDASVVYYTVGDAAAQAVAATVAGDIGGVTIAEMPSPPPIDVGLGTSTVLVMVGTDTANKTLADLSPASVTPPPVAGTPTTAPG